jgi:5-methylcytosine-specific restriction endonuclease McrA
MGKAKISDTVRAKVLARDSYICRACGFGGSANFAFALDCDHILPESAGGANKVENLQCLCKGCNVAKSDKMAWEFKARTETVAESVWAVNQKIVATAFTVGIKEGSVGKTLKRLK